MEDVERICNANHAAAISRDREKSMLRKAALRERRKLYYRRAAAVCYIGAGVFAGVFGRFAWTGFVPACTVVAGVAAMVAFGWLYDAESRR